MVEKENNGTDFELFWTRLMSYNFDTKYDPYGIIEHGLIWAAESINTTIICVYFGCFSGECPYGSPYRGEECIAFDFKYRW